MGVGVGVGGCGGEQKEYLAIIEYQQFLLKGGVVEWPMDINLYLQGGLFRPWDWFFIK